MSLGEKRSIAAKERKEKRAQTHINGCKAEEEGYMQGESSQEKPSVS